MEPVSECCGAPAGQFLDYGICPECREHCDFEDEEEHYNEEAKQSFDGMFKGSTPGDFPRRA